MGKAIQFKCNGEKIYPCPYYPVGSIYMCVNNTNPELIFGGKWEQIKDRFLLACGNLYSNGSTGGNSEHSHSLSSKGYAQISLHGDGTIRYNELNNSKGVSNWNSTYKVNANSGSGESGYTSSWGAGLGGKTDSASTLPPYLAIYVWKRVS